MKDIEDDNVKPLSSSQSSGAQLPVLEVVPNGDAENGNKVEVLFTGNVSINICKESPD